MRSFIAIELPKEIKDTLAQIQETLKKQGADVKWVEPKNIHLTIKFLGEIDEQKLAKVISIMEEAVKDKNTFSLRIWSLGAFPKLDYPKVIWVGLKQGDRETKIIAEGLEEKITKLGIPKEKRSFSSHITLGRVKSNLNRLNLVTVLKNLEGSLEKENLEFVATKITLFKSTLTPQGPIYDALKEINLKAT